MILRRETNIYDDEAIKNSIASVDKKFSATYGTCSTAAGTAAKVVTLSDFVLFKGAQISVFFSYANTVASPTLNVNGTGAKAIWARGAAITATYYWSANSTHVFTYDGTHWVLENAESQEEVYKRLTNNDTNSGLYIENGSLYLKADYIRSGKISADYIYGGKLTLGGANNVNGEMVVYDASGTEIGRWDNSGITATGNFHLKNGLIEYYIGKCLTMYVDYIAGNYYADDIDCIAAVWNNSSGKTVGRRTWHNRGDCMQEITMTTNSHVVNGHYFGISLSDMNMSPVPTTSNPIKSGYHIWEEYSSDRYYLACEKHSPFSYMYKLEITNSGGKINNKAIELVSSSSKRYKHDITADISEGIDAHKLYELQMKQFVFNDNHLTQYPDMKGKTIPGFIAEDVAEIYPSAVIYNEKGEVESWDERRIIPAMLKLIQEQHEEIEKLKQVIHVV